MHALFYGFNGILIPKFSTVLKGPVGDKHLEEKLKAGGGFGLLSYCSRAQVCSSTCNSVCLSLGIPFMSRNILLLFGEFLLLFRAYQLLRKVDILNIKKANVS